MQTSEQQTETQAEGAAAATTTTETTTEKPAEAAAEPSFDELVRDAMAKAGVGSSEAAAAEEPKEGAAGEEKAEEAKAGGEGEGEGEEAKPEEKVEEEKPAEPKKEPGMTARLALVARKTREIETRERAVAEREAKLAPVVDFAERVRKAPNRAAMMQETLGGFGELRDFFVELNDYILEYNGGDKGGTGGAAKASKALSAADVDQLVATKVKEALAAVEAERTETARARNEAGRQRYADDVHTHLDTAEEKYPLCYARPPRAVAITAISDEILRQTGKLPDADTVLQKIEEHRQEERQKKPAPPSSASQTSGKSQITAPVRRNSVPVVPARTLSFDEEVAAATKQLERRA